MGFNQGPSAAVADVAPCGEGQTENWDIPAFGKIFRF